MVNKKDWNKSKRKVKTVAVPKGAVLQVKVPAGHAPLVVPIPHENVVEIVPVPKSATAKRPWWNIF
jgi:hypothetical protein